MQSSCSVGSRWQSKLVPADMHTVCSNRISSPTPSLFHFPRLPHVCYPLSYPFSTSRLSAPYWYERKSVDVGEKNIEGWLYSPQNVSALCIRRDSINQRQKKKNVLARLNGNVSIIHVMGALFTDAFFPMLSLSHDEGRVSENPFITCRWDLHIVWVECVEMKLSFWICPSKTWVSHSSATGIKKAGLAFVTSWRSVL